MSRKSTVALFTWLTCCALGVYWRALGLPYALDDFAQLQALAAMRAGVLPLASWFVLPHNEHVVPLLRILFAAATRLGGLDAAPARLILMMVHVAGGMACALLAARVSRHRAAAWLAGTLYVGAAGFTGSAVWVVAQFSMAAVCLWFALLAVAGPGAARRTAIPASLGLVLLGCLALPWVALASLCLPLYLHIAKPKLDCGRRSAIAVYVTAALAVLLGTAAILSHWRFPPPAKPPIAGVPGGFWLILSAPYRFAASWLPVPDANLVLNLPRAVLCAVATWLLLPLSGRWLEERAKRLLTAVWMADGLFCLLIGIGRPDFLFLTLFTTDRYYYFLLLPLALHAALLLGALMERLAGYRKVATCVLCAAVLVGLAGSRRKMEMTIPWELLQLYSQALGRGKTLVHTVATRAAARPLVLADGEIPFDGLPSGKIAFSTFFFTEFPDGLPGVKWRFASAKVSPGDADAENRLLDGWSQAVGQSTPVCVVDGTMQETGVGAQADFRKGGYDSAVVRGFYLWERSFRWMSREGRLRLRGPGAALTVVAFAPLDLIRRKWPSLPGMKVQVSADSIALGELLVTRSDEQEFQLPLPEQVRTSLSAGRSIEIAIESALSWRGMEIDLPDDRELSIGLRAIRIAGTGAENQPAAETRCVSYAAASSIR